MERAREITLLNGDYPSLSLSPPPSGCNPCVMDIYEKDMETWFKLKSMSKEEREEIWKGKQSKHETNETALSPEKYNKLKKTDAAWKSENYYVYSCRFELVSVVQVSKDSFVYSFKLPRNQVLGLGAGQHGIMRYGNETLFALPLERFVAFLNDRLRTKEGKYVTRQYTPISPLHQREKFEVLIKATRSYYCMLLLFFVDLQRWTNVQLHSK